MSSSSSRTSASPSRTGRPGKTERLQLATRRGWTPPPRISVPDWADRFRHLAKEAGSTSGRWRTSTVEVARGPMLAVTEPGVHVISAMVCTQLLKTALLENTFGYFAHLDPAPMLLLQPKEAAAEQFSKERITPLIRVTPSLRALVGSAKTRNADETLLYKSFPGGFLALAGAGSPDNLARRPIRVLLCDEVDKYPITREGEPIALAEERTATFGANWLSLRVCSPTVEGESRIEASYAASDQRRASTACPHCGHRQFPEFFRHVDWSKDEIPGGQTVHRPETAAIYCEACGDLWSEGERLRALRTTRWHQTRPFTCCGELQTPLQAYETAWRSLDPEADHAGAVAATWDWWEGPRHAVYRARCRCCGTWAVPNEHAGFQASKLFSPWPKDRPADVAKKWLAAAGNEEWKQTWWNTQAALPYRQNAGKALRVEDLAKRGEVWDGEVPDGVGLLTAGVDVQQDRIEVEIIGWGRNEESWSLAYEILEGDPNTDAPWDMLDALLLRRWHRADGRPFAIAAACVDTGGSATEKAYQFCKARLGRKIWGIKGESAQNGVRNPVWPTKRPMARKKATYRPVILGVNSAKDMIHARLQVEAHGAGFMHVPAERDINWYHQLTAERLIKKTSGVLTYRVWDCPRHKTNEALDCRVYGYAALCGLLHFGIKLNVRVDQVSERYVAPAGQEAPTFVAAAPRQQLQLGPAPLGPVTLPQPTEPAPRVGITVQKPTRAARASRYAR